MDTNEKKKYEAPELTDFGSIEKVTQGLIDPGIGDIPAGAIDTVENIVSGVVGDLP